MVNHQLRHPAVKKADPQQFHDQAESRAALMAQT
jgi:hypothetical protein